MKRKLRLKSWVKVELILIIVLIALLKINSELDKNFIEKCTSNGYSEYYCEVHK